MGKLLLPYGSDVLNTTIPTRIRRNSQSLIDFILTDHNEIRRCRTLISDTLFKNTKNKEIDHRETSIVAEIEVREPPKVSLKHF